MFPHENVPLHDSTSINILDHRLQYCHENLVYKNTQTWRWVHIPSIWHQCNIRIDRSTNRKEVLSMTHTWTEVRKLKVLMQSGVGSCAFISSSVIWTGQSGNSGDTCAALEKWYSCVIMYLHQLLHLCIPRPGFTSRVCAAWLAGRIVTLQFLHLFVDVCHRLLCMYNYIIR